MPRRTPASASDSTPEHPLTTPLEKLTEELKLIRTVLDEIRTDLQWAVQNRDAKREAGPSVDPTNAGRLLNTFEEGDAVEVNDGVEPSFGEISSIDDARNEATVILIPSNEVVTVSQDSISRVAPDQLRRAFERMESDSSVDATERIPTVAEIQSDQKRHGKGNGKLF